MSLRRWNVRDNNRSQRHERYWTFRCLRNITFDYAINLFNWHDIENDCNNIEISKYCLSFIRNSRWLWLNSKIRWFNFQKSHKNLCVEVNSEIHHEFAWFRIIRVDKNCSNVVLFWTNSIFVIELIEWFNDFCYEHVWQINRDKQI